MADSKTYLNVPYAQKDAAKALGARWDASHKKWYVPANKDLMLFAQWHTESNPLPSSSTASSSKTGVSITATGGVITPATINDFVGYNGQEPPWD